MGSANLSLLSSPTLYYSVGINPSKTSVNPKFSSQFRCSFSSRPRWDPYPDSSRADRFDFDEDFRFGGGGRPKRRNWWSDDEDDDDDDDDEEEDDDDVFGLWEEPSAIDWIFKILGAFAWMIPVVGISALLGTGSNSLIMALVLPLGQTALSLAMDKLWGGPSSSPEPRPRRRSRRGPEGSPFASSSSGSRKTKRRAQGPRTGTRPMNRSYRNCSSAAKGGSKFGGWDELDDFNNTTTTVPNAEGKNQKAEGIGEEERIVKLRLRRKGDRPLFFRLLIAVFPFLGSWTRFLF